MRIILLGAPGSGKGTQAKTMSEKLNIKRISLGDILREEVKKNTSLGEKVKEYMYKGLLVPDKIVSMVVEENIDSEDFVIDGYPRNTNQAKDLDNILSKKNLSLDKAIYLEVSQETAIKRLSGRRICKNCGANYHIENMPPKKEGICDICGGMLIQRKDDEPEVIKNRWTVFQKENVPLMNFYKEKDKLIIVDGNQTAEEVFQEILKKLNHG
ncbi:MAG: adenylate kinase [Candidatus Omnitrophica bacterium]|nr:adenylate kinase [Candidatus Omnitrophota bacterium]